MPSVAFYSIPMRDEAADCGEHREAAGAIVPNVTQEI